MRVMAFGHSRIAMPELRCNDGAGDAFDGEPAGVGMAQNVKPDRRCDLCYLARGTHRPELVCVLPRCAIGSREQKIASGFATGSSFEELDALCGQVYVARL